MGRGPRGLPCSWHRVREKCRMAWAVWTPLPSWAWTCPVVGAPPGLALCHVPTIPRAWALPSGTMSPAAEHSGTEHHLPRSRVPPAAEHSGTEHHLPRYRVSPAAEYSGTEHHPPRPRVSPVAERRGRTTGFSPLKSVKIN